MLRSSAPAQAGAHQRVKFTVAAATDLPGEEYDLVCLFDCLHDMGDPVRAAPRIRQALASAGTLLLVEPNAGDALEDNLNPIGAPITVCPLSSACRVPIAQQVGFGLGAGW